MGSPFLFSRFGSSCSDCVGEYDIADYVELDTFPVDLNLLFWEDQPLIQAENLNLIGNGSHGWMLTPWGGHFISNHFEGADKWYFYCGRPLEIIAPIEGKVKNYRINDGTPSEILGNDVITDVRLEINIGDGFSIRFEHLTILSTLHEEVKDGHYTFTKGELLGYPTVWGPDLVTIDFHYLYKGKNICPYPAFSPEIQAEILEKFNMQYERAKIGGAFPESRLCNPYDIYLPNTIWGVWEYKSGPFDSILNSERVFGFQPGGFTLLNRNLTNPETFWRDPINMSQNLSAQVIGIFRDGTGDSVPGYSKIGNSIVEQAEGDEHQGILKLTTIDTWDWGSNTTLFMRYALELNREKLKDDELRIEYFDNLLDAQTGFTPEGEIYYLRFLGYLTWGDIQLYVILGAVGLGLTLIGLTLLIVIRIRRKRKLKKLETP
jgi:hypothetical protein